MPVRRGSPRSKPAAPDAVELDDVADAVARAVRALPRPLRFVVRARMRGASCERIAAHLGCSAKMVRTRSRHARDRLASVAELAAL